MSEHSPIQGKTPDQANRVLRAAERQVQRNARTAAEQLAVLDTRPGESARERARLAS